MARNPYYIDGSADGRGAGTEPLSSLHHSVGINNVGSYQVSGLPYMTGSGGIPVTASGDPTNMQHRIQFPAVTKSITVINTGETELRIHFVSAVYNAATFPQGSSHVMGNYHYVPLASNKDSMTMNVKCDEIFITNMDTSTVGKFSLYAELTQIPHARMRSPLSGSGLNMELGGTKAAGDRS